MKKSFRVGDKTVEFGRVFRIFKIGKRRQADGQTQTMIHYRHYYKTDQNHDLLFAIPEKNVVKTNIRRPLSLNKIRFLLKSLARKPSPKIAVRTVSIKSTLNLNDARKTARVLKLLYLDRAGEPSRFNKTKRDLYNLAMRRLAEEVALVQKIPLAKAKVEIRQRLASLA